MRYAKEFNAKDYVVPSFLESFSDWQDVSWHNDTAPRWENQILRLAVWVDCIDPNKREFDDWKQYTVCRIILQSNDLPLLEEGPPLFETDDITELENWIAAYDTYYHVGHALDAIQDSTTPNEEICDELHTVEAKLKEYLKLS